MEQLQKEVAALQLQREELSIHLQQTESELQASKKAAHTLQEVGYLPRNTVSQDVHTRFPVQLAFAKFLSKIKGNF